MRLLRIALPLLVGITAALIVTLANAQDAEPYWFEVDTSKAEITEGAAGITIEPRFRAVADDRLPYEIYVNSSRRGFSTDAGKHFDSFRRTENWIIEAMLALREDELEGNKDLLLLFQFEQQNFLIDNGLGRYSGYIGPTKDPRSPKFEEILSDGTRNNVTNIPGWAGITASQVESARSGQATSATASIWASITEDGRPWGEQYYADWNNADQRNYPGRLIEPLHLLLGLHTHFAAGTKLKIGESARVTRRFPLGVVPGASTEYEFTYTLEKLYGSAEEPTAARFTFSATPKLAKQNVKVGDFAVEFEAPAIEKGTLLFDLKKGVSADIAWAVAIKGAITQPGTSLRTEFSTETDFRASLRRKPPKKDD